MVRIFQRAAGLVAGRDRLRRHSRPALHASAVCVGRLLPEHSVLGRASQFKADRAAHSGKRPLRPATCARVATQGIQGAGYMHTKNSPGADEVPGT